MSKLFSKENGEVFSSPLNLNNPIAVQVLGICSALAVTSQMEPAIVMGLSVTVSMVLKAFAYDVSVQLSVYVGLIITNCILMGRLEAFAMMNGPWESFLDGIGNGLGYAYVLVLVGTVREFFGNGSLMGFQIIPQSFYDMGYMNNGMMTMPAMALILLGCFIWAHRAYNERKEKK